MRASAFERYTSTMTQDGIVQRRSRGQRWIIPIIVLVVGLLFWWDSTGPEYPPHYSHKLRLRLMTDVSRVRADQESVDQYQDFIWQEAISAIVDLTEPLDWSLSEDGMERVLMVKGAKGGLVRVFFDEETKWLKTVERGEQEQ